MHIHRGPRLARMEPIANIIILLPRNRLHVGRLIVADADVLSLHECDCLGKADNARAARERNPERDPTRPYGDTPAGLFSSPGIVTFAAPHPRLGHAWLPMEGIQGQAHKAVLGGRTGLGIHAGRGNDRLVPTYGCVRVRDADFGAIEEIVKGAAIRVLIVEVAGV